MKHTHQGQKPGRQEPYAFRMKIEEGPHKPPPPYGKEISPGLYQSPDGWGYCDAMVVVMFQRLPDGSVSAIPLQTCDPDSPEAVPLMVQAADILVERIAMNFPIPASQPPKTGA